MQQQFWLVDNDHTQVTVAFMPADGQKINKMTLPVDAKQQQVAHFLHLLTNLRESQRFNYLSFASRFWEMPLLIFAKRQTAKEIIQLVGERQKVLTSLDSPFKVINRYPKLWNQQEVSQLSNWQHNAHFLDIRTLDGRIDHGELSRYDRYLSQLGYPQPVPGMPLVKRLPIKLLNLRRLFSTSLFQECWNQHVQVMAKFYSEITKDPREKWQGMMTIMPTTTDAETIEAILYRNHHIHDRPRLTIEDPGIESSWGRKLLTFYQAYDGIDRHDPYALRRVHLSNKGYRPPLILNEDKSWFALLPSEGGLHGFTVRKNSFLASEDYLQSNNFNQPNHATNVLKIERPLINQELLLQMGCFDPHAQKIVQEMVDNVNGHELAPSLMSKLAQKLLHAMKGSSDTAFDNHLKQPNTILQMRLNVQLKLIRLCELLVAHHFTLLSVNSTIIYVAPAANASLSLLNHLPDGFHVTDQGKNWFGKSPNDHVYQSNAGGYQLAGDNVNHFAGPNNWTDQQRPTITERVLVEYLMKEGCQQPVKRQTITSLLQHHLDHFHLQEWVQPILSSKLKQIFAIADNGKRALIADPVLTGFFTTNPADYTISRIFSSNHGPASDPLAEKLAKRVGLGDHFRISKHYLKVEQRQLYNGRHLSLFFAPHDVDRQQLIRTIDLTTYQQIVLAMLNTWIPQPDEPSVDQLGLEI